MLLQRQAVVRGQEPITLPPNSEPEPNLVIAKNRSDRYLSNQLSAHPSQRILQKFASRVTST